MARDSRISLGFAAAFAIFLLGVPAIGTGPFPPNPELHWQDVLDLATPIALLPLYWLLVRQPQTAGDLDGRELFAFLGLGALWVEAQGMHLASNSINNVIHGDLTAPAAGLTHLWDEVISHYLWHIAVIGLAVLAVVRQRRNPLPNARPSLAAEIAAGVLYGLSFFVIVVEGATGPLGVPAAAAIGVGGLALSGHRLRREPITAFLVAGHVFALALFGAWWFYWGGRLPQFSEVL